MKVLWFTNTVSLASEVLKDNGIRGGWIASLEKQMSNVHGIELAVAFHYRKGKMESFEIGKTKYFSMPNFNVKGRLKRLWNRWKYRIEPEIIIDDYLKIIHEFNPDIIHIFGTEQSFGSIIPLLKIPVVIQIQGNLTVYSKKWFSGLSFANIFLHSNIKSLLTARSLLHEYVLFLKRARREQKIFNYCRYFIGRTDWDRRITKALSDKAEYYHCDELLRENFYQKKWMKPSNKKLVLVSTLSSASYKGLETILEAAAILKKKKLFELEWHIAGITGEEELIKIIQRALKLKFADYNISFNGLLKPEELLQLLLQTNFFIHPSHIENSPNSVCEAMLIGMPVIATYAGGTPSIIADKQEGILIQDGDPFALAGAIIELFEDPDFANDLAENAREKALLRHNSEKVVRDLLTIYSDIIAKA